jgi:hypothetical protein
MSKNELSNCEYLLAEEERVNQGISSCRYTKYLCILDNERCVGAEVKPLKFWKMRDDLNLEIVNECPKRTKFNSELKATLVEILKRVHGFL